MPIPMPMPCTECPRLVVVQNCFAARKVGAHGVHCRTTTQHNTTRTISLPAPHFERNELNTTNNHRQQQRESREPEHYGMVALAMIVREDLREEFKRASGILAISRERQMTEELARCRPYVDARPPDTSAIKELQRVRYECTVEFSDAGHQLFQAKRG